MAKIRTGLIGLTVLGFALLQSCSSSNDDNNTVSNPVGGSTSGPVSTGGRTATSTGGSGGVVAAAGGTYPSGTLSCSYRGTCAHPYCTAGAALDPGCAPCAWEVCQMFPLCCTAMWDTNCMVQAQASCSCACGANTGGAPSTGGRPATGGRPGGAGTAGAKTGGAAGSQAGGAGGVSVGGSAGADTGGVPAVGGAGGVPAVGGAAGADTGGVPAAGGTGGTGGDGGLTLQEACTDVCAVTQDASLAACAFDSTDCNAMCTGYLADPGAAAPAEYPPMVQCLATLTASQWECSTDPFDGTMYGAIPAGSGPCETEICAWTCADGTVADNTAFARCGC
jgi:hypothetical protein